MSEVTADLELQTAESAGEEGRGREDMKAGWFGGRGGH